MDNQINAGKDIHNTDTILQTLEAIQAGVWDYRPGLKKIILSGQNIWDTMLGHPLKNKVITVDELFSYIHPQDLSNYIKLHREFMINGGKGEIEVQLRLRRADGSWHWILSKGRAVEWDEKGTPSRIIGIDINIQALREAHERIRQSEIKFRTIFENAPYAISISSLEDSKFIDGNQAFLDTLGVSKEELHLKSPSDFSTLSDEEVTELIEELLEKGVASNRETLSIKNGKPKYTKFSCVLMEDQGKKQVMALAEDITQAKLAEIALIESEMRFRMLFKMAPVPMAHISRNGELLDLNDRLTQAMGHTISEVPTLERAWDLAMPDPELREAVTGRWKRDLEDAIASNSDMEPFECPLHYMDGSVHNLIISTKLINDSIIVSFFDITDRKKAEKEREKLQAQLYNSQKLEAVGILAGGVAHDFNNMLGGILGYTELTLSDMSPDDPSRDNLLNILKATRRSADLTRQLLTFARKQTISPVVLNLNESIESVLKMVRRLIGENIDLAWHPGSDTCVVRMDPTQLDQILINFCVNARDAITDVGKITIKTDTVSFDQKYCDNHAYLKPGNYVMLAVSDDGSGMEKETMEHIFEPFYTTKDPGKGTGLGLATVYGVVKQNNGFINVNSESGKGTTFSVYLPLVEEEASEKEKRGTDTIPRGNGETVLLVEDDETVLSMASIMLGKLGYRVFTAGTASEGFSIAEEHKAGIQVLVTDVIMPKINGRELAERIELIIPEIKILFMSGYTSTIIAHHGVLDEGINFIQKPFSVNDLAFSMQKVLQSAPGIKKSTTG